MIQTVHDVNASKGNPWCAASLPHRHPCTRELGPLRNSPHSGELTLLRRRFASICKSLDS